MIFVGLDSITSLYDPGSLKCFRDNFPEAPEEAFTQAHGQENLLIYINNRRLHPKRGKDVDNTRLVESIVGCGAILTGTTHACPDPQEWD